MPVEFTAGRAAVPLGVAPLGGDDGVAENVAAGGSVVVENHAAGRARGGGSGPVYKGDEGAACSKSAFAERRRVGEIEKECPVPKKLHALAVCDELNFHGSVGHVHVVFLIAANGGTVGGWKNLGVDMRERVVEVEWLVAMGGEEVRHVLVHHVRQVDVVGQRDFLPVRLVGFGFVLRVPVGAVALELEVVIEAELGGPERKQPKTSDLTLYLLGNGPRCVCWLP